METQPITNWRAEKIAIEDLYLWDENARFPDKYFSKAEEELIKFFCNSKEKDFRVRDFKIGELAEAIVTDFDLPQLEKLVVWDFDGKFTVLEGNRRLTAYKLLDNPDLTQNDSLKSKIMSLKSKIDIAEDFDLECLVTENIKEGLRFIDRKHLNKNNELGWGDQERANHKVRQGSANKKELFKVSIADHIKKLDIPETMKEQILGPGYVTNFWRIIDSAPSWEKFQIRFDSEGILTIGDKDFDKKLKVIIVNILKKEDFSGNKLDSRTLNTNKEKEGYLGSIGVNDCDKALEEIKKGTDKNLFGEESTDVSSKNIKLFPKSTSRSYLIPKTCRLIINETKINNIYRELRDDLLLDDSKKAVPNAVGVVFRVFLETSIDCFWEKNGKTFKEDTKLAGKITTVANFMEKNKIADAKQLKNIRTVSSIKYNLLAIENFHRYVHSYKTQPTSSDLKTKWDNLEEFFQILWKSLEEKV